MKFCSHSHEPIYPLMTIVTSLWQKMYYAILQIQLELKISNYDSQVGLLITILSFSINGYKKVRILIIR